MKKLVFYTTMIGLAAGIGFWLYRKEKEIRVLVITETEKNITEVTVEENDDSQTGCKSEEIDQIKSESVKEVYERHVEAANIMKAAYSNIMENFVEDFSEESTKKREESNKNSVVDNENVEMIKEIDSISDELDNLFM